MAFHLFHVFNSGSESHEVSKDQQCVQPSQTKEWHMFLEWRCVYLSFIRVEVPLIGLTLEQAVEQ